MQVGLTESKRLSERNYECLDAVRQAELWHICLVTLRVSNGLGVPRAKKHNKFSTGGDV